MKFVSKRSVVVLLVIAVGCAFSLSQAQAADATYLGASQCKMCHNKKDEGEQWNKWKAVKHSGAFETLKSPAAVKIGQDKGLPKPPSESPECLKCHVTGYDAAAKTVPEKIKMEDGVQCEACHGPGSEHAAAGKKFLFSKDTSIDMAATQKKVEAATCLKCHNEESPNWNPERYTLKDGAKAGFDFDQAYKKIQHLNPKKHPEAAAG